jgi:hypothetical protein
MMKKTVLLACVAMMGYGVSMAEMTPGEVELTRSVVQTQRKAIVEMNMALDNETAKTFWPLYNEYQDGLRKVNDRSVALIQDYAGSWLELSDEKAASLTDEMLSIQMEKAKVRRSFAKKFRKQLPAKAVARFFQIENKLDAIVNYDLAASVPLAH